VVSRATSRPASASGEKPCSDELFRVYRSMYTYELPRSRLASLTCMPPYLLFPRIQRLLAHPEFPGHVTSRTAAFQLLHRRDELLLAVSALFIRRFPFQTGEL
jgi:hypothetical protein